MSVLQRSLNHVIKNTNSILCKSSFGKTIGKCFSLLRHKKGIKDFCLPYVVNLDFYKAPQDIIQVVITHLGFLKLETLHLKIG